MARNFTLLYTSVENDRVTLQFALEPAVAALAMCTRISGGCLLYVYGLVTSILQATPTGVGWNFSCRGVEDEGDDAHGVRTYIQWCQQRVCSVPHT